MNKFIKYNVVCLLGASILIAGNGCKKLLEPDPIGTQTVDVTYSTLPGAIMGVNGIYATFSNGELYKGGNHWLQVDQASDDMMDDVKGESTVYNFIDYFELAPNNEYTFQWFDGFYKAIYRANIAIERIPKLDLQPGELTNSNNGLLWKDQLVGEAKFFRAFSYFNLVRAFGGVPLHVKEIKVPSEVNIPRSTPAEVYAQIESDLTDAIAKLPATKFGTNTGHSGNEPGRVHKWSALALLADVYLTQKKYELAKSTALQVINNNGGKALNARYRDNFFALVGNAAENTKESLFEIQFYKEGANQWDGNRPRSNNFSYKMGPFSADWQNLQRFRPTATNTIASGPILSGLVEQYETGDERKDVNVSKTGFSNGQSNSIFLTRKYYEGIVGNNGDGNYPIYRMAEMYLIYAEASNELAGPDATSIGYVNLIRRRAFNQPGGGATVDLTAAQTQDQASFREAIRQERRRELALENKRWFDLVRYGYDYAYQALVVQQGRTGFNQNRMLFPIAQDELTRNPLLVQNPGY